MNFEDYLNESTETPEFGKNWKAHKKINKASYHFDQSDKHEAAAKAARAKSKGTAMRPDEHIHKANHHMMWANNHAVRGRKLNGHASVSDTYRDNVADIK